MLPRLDAWMRRYEIEIARDRDAKPGKYLWPDSKMPEILDRMRDGFVRGAPHYNKDSEPIRACCRYFKIAPTYGSIDRYLRGE